MQIPNTGLTSEFSEVLRYFGLHRKYRLSIPSGGRTFRKYYRATLGFQSMLFSSFTYGGVAIAA